MATDSRQQAAGSRQRAGQSPIVLVHGAFRGGWCWRGVRSLLAGHEVWTPDLTGAGARAHLNRESLTLGDWVNDVVNLLEYEDLRDVILVGHSMGGVIITAASEYAADRIAHLIYLDAPVPQHGQAAADLIPEAVRNQFGPAPRNGLIAPIPVQPNADITPEQAAWINKRLTPVPAGPSYEPVKLLNPKALALPRSYVFCDRAPPFFPASFTRQRFDQDGAPYRLLPAGHDVMLTHPQLVAELLEQLAAESCYNGGADDAGFNQKWPYLGAFKDDPTWGEMFDEIERQRDATRTEDIKLGLTPAR